MPIDRVGTQVGAGGVRLEQKAPRSTSGLMLKPAANPSLRHGAITTLYSKGMKSPR